MTIVTTIGWCMALAAVYFVDKARPMGFKMDRFFGVGRRRIWDAESVEVAFWLTIAALGCGVVALVVDLNRVHRRDEGASWATLGLALGGLLGFVAHLVAFG